MAANFVITPPVVLASLSPAAHGSTVENAAAHEAALDGEEAAEAWAEWAKQEAAAGFGLDKDDAEVAAKETVQKAGDFAVRTKETVSDVTSEATSVAEAAEMAGEVKDKVMDKAADVKETMGGSLSMEDASKAHEGVKQKAAEAFEAAKDAMSHGPKETY